MWYPIHAINLNLLQVKGRSDLFLKLEILKKIVGVVILCVTIPLGLIAMCVGGIVSSMVGLVINTYYSGKLINVGYLRQMRDVMPTFVLSLVSGTIVYITVNNLCLSPLLLLIIGIIVGFIIYVATAYFLHFSEIDEIKEIIKKNQTNNM
jgi:O-antigen/teichoic acid export membrane protein